MPEEFEIEIVHGMDKPLAITEAETIQDVKIAAMGLFDIPAGEASQYVLRVKVQGQDQQLNEAETVAQAKLHPHEKVILAAGAPFGGH